MLFIKMLQFREVLIGEDTEDGQRLSVAWDRASAAAHSYAF